MRITLHHPGTRNLHQNGWCNHAGKHRKRGFDPLDDDDDAEDGEDLAEWLAGKPMSKAGGSVGTST
jgi:hypothetical protein